MLGQRGIAVVGVGTAEAPFDVALVTAIFTAEAASAAEALRQADAAAARAQAAAQEAGAASTRVVSRDVRAVLREGGVWGDGTDDPIASYRARLSLSARIETAAALGPAIGRPRGGRRRPHHVGRARRAEFGRTASQSARAAAMRDALQAAERIAAAAGAPLGALEHIEDRVQIFGPADAPPPSSKSIFDSSYGASQPANRAVPAATVPGGDPRALGAGAFRTGSPGGGVAAGSPALETSMAQRPENGAEGFRVSRRRRVSRAQKHADAAVLFALFLNLPELHRADLSGRAHMGAAAGLQIHRRLA